MMANMQNFAEFCEMIRQKTLPVDDVPVELHRIRQAAVTILLRKSREDMELLILKRAEHPDDPWSGHLALPGGRADHEDGHLAQTAIRETWEETGLKLSLEENYLGRLETLTPGNPRLPRIEITPFIAAIKNISDIRLQLNAEATAATWVSVQRMQASGRDTHYRITRDNIEYKWPAFTSDLGLIWGITERIISSFLKSMASDEN
jgi:8-oxo-dGTP pyrophosphatase MutT (NUDIX family)